MADNNLDHLHQAIARNSAAVLSLPSAGMLRHYKTRFLAPAEEGFWIESVAGEISLIESLIGEKKSAGISFKAPDNIKVVFTVPILQREPSYQVNAEVRCEALRVALPAQVKAVQRRTQYRVHLPQENDLKARIWRIPERFHLSDRPMSAAEIPFQVVDISAGGLGIICLPKDDKPQRVVADERLRVIINFRGGDDVLIEGRMLHPTPLPNKAVKAGVSFKKLVDDLVGRQNYAKLTTIVGQLQRDEVRRMRMG